MYKYKSIYFVVIIMLLGACKIKQEIPQNRPLLAMPQKFIAKQDSSAIDLPTIKSFFSDSTLVALIDTAFTNNFDLQMTLQKIEIARAGVRFTQGLGKPDLAANVTIGQRKFGNYTVDGVGNYDTQFSTNINEKQQIPDPIIPDYYLGVQSSWEIDIWGKLKSQKASAAAKLLASQSGKNLVVSELVALIASAYYELLILDNELDFLEENIILQERAVEITRVLKQAGQANQLGVDLLNAQLLSSKALKIEVKQEIVEAESKLNFLVGRYPQAIIRQKVAWAKVIPPKLTVGIPSRLLENRPDIKQAEYELLATNANLFTAKAAFYPSLNLTGGLGLQSFKALLWLNPASLAMNTFGGLTAPLANRRQIIADLMASKSDQKMAYLNYQKTVVNSFTEVYNQLNLIQNTNEMYDLKVQEVDVLRLSINNSAELFRSGRATYLEVITAQKNALQSQIELINLKKRQYNAVIGLYKSLGGGWNK
ncbi:TolC family protein [Arcicella sp. LKC2W]|uniref:TolC family protein n=1 Tax=Arcicella sp. LKC2W TaxID=2984198 RepID=UPI002B21F245|nr:TolC family protein [Arcicella sp. LKC2W]MEA5461770.1 TolC family protein [Arcicella sp. LKC2W]